MSNDERLNAKDLLHIQENKHKKNKEIYRQILKDIENKIKFQNEIGNTKAIVKIPYMKIGYPIYNITHAMMYVLNKLNKHGFSIGNIQENSILILWNQPDKKEEPQKKEKKIKGILRKK